MNTTFEVSDGLSERARAFWDAHVDAVTEPAPRELLWRAVVALSRADGAAAAIDREGLLTYYRGRDVANPAAAVERESVRLFLRLVEALGLDGGVVGRNLGKSVDGA